jgi:hypothetical protein
MRGLPGVKQVKYLSKPGTNAKTAKSDKAGEYLTAILYLLPDLELCPMSERAGCAVACLNTAGRGAFSNVQESRRKKSQAFKANPIAFVDQLKVDIASHIRFCERRGKKPAVRLNGTSDIDWSKIKGSDGKNVFSCFPSVQFYDYTKMIKRKSLDNYHLTASYSETNAKYASMVAASDKNIAVVFRDRLPKEFLGRPVIDGDKHDLRFLDPPGSVVGLIAKGSAKRDNSGFVIARSV